jgi:prepilin-type N-terminal cleavage/methylation domain-containing protein
MTARAIAPVSQRRQGLTLLELIVVLVILAALAGMVVPLLPSMTGRIHTTTGATNVSEINKFLQTHQQLYQEYPTDFDALVDASGTLANYLPGGNVGGQISPLLLTEPQRQALFNAGITQLAAMHPTTAALAGAGGTPTFNPYTGAAISLASGTPTVAQVSELAVETTARVVRDLSGLQDVYVIVGLGSRCSMVGKSITEAPVHFGEGNGASATIVYGRYGAIFRVARGGTALSKAFLVGVVALHADGITTSNAHLEEYYKLQQAQRKNRAGRGPVADTSGSSPPSRDWA